MKPQAGQSGAASPFRSRRTITKVVSAADNAQRRAAGRAVKPTYGANSGAFVRVKNLSGTAITRGTAVQLGESGLELFPRWDTGPPDYEIIYPNDRQFYFDGDLPAGEAHQLSKNYAIAAEDLPEDAYGLCHAAGIAVARVNVTDTTHACGMLNDASGVFQSGDFGHVELLSIPVDTGEQEIVVRMGPAGSNFLWGKSNANYGSSGACTISIWTGEAGSTYDTGIDLVAYTKVILTTGKKVALAFDYATTYLVFKAGW